MTPKTATERLFRDNVLALARDFPFARSLVNAGRLSKPCGLRGSSLQTADEGTTDGLAAAGSPCLDAPVMDAAGRSGWLLGHLGGDFTVLILADAPPDAAGELAKLEPAPKLCVVAGGNRHAREPSLLLDVDGLVHARYGAAGATYLVRPDQHIAARFCGFDLETIGRALGRAAGRLA